MNESSEKKAIARKQERKRERGQQGIKRRSTQRQLLGYSGWETSVPEFGKYNIYLSSTYSQEALKE